MHAPQAEIVEVQDLIEWPDFLRQHDPVWEYLPQSWGEGAFLGDGHLGAMIYSGGDDIHRLKSNQVRWELGLAGATAQGDRSQYLEPRLLIGDFLLDPKGVIGWEASRMRLDLWQAELTGEIVSSNGSIRINSFVHATQRILVVDLDYSECTELPSFDFHPKSGVSAFDEFRDEASRSKIPHPPEPIKLVKNGVHMHVQPLLTGGECVTAWYEAVISKDHRRFWIVVEVDHGSQEAREIAYQRIDSAVKTAWQELLSKHRNWWSDYYPASFLSIPDTRLEGFYWIQIYKMGSATRADAPLLDILGPWMTRTPWPGNWWNLNAQFSYAPYYASNRHVLAESLSRAVESHFDNLIANAPEQWRHDSAALGRAGSVDMLASTGPGDELGNLAWLCLCLWRHYRMDMDTAFLKRVLYPALFRAIQLYLHVLEAGDDGRLHLPATISPEFSGHQNCGTRDCHYDLALLRWGCRVLIESAETLAIDAEKVQQWQNVLERLVDFPVDSTGYRIGADLSLNHGHRHFSHLMAGYPLFVIDPASAKESKLWKQSLEHWLGLGGALTGFSFTYAAAAYAHLKEGGSALACLNILLDRFLKPNTMYTEKGPVIETPLHGADALHEMLLQSSRGEISVFPAIPSDWENATFVGLAAEGGYRISAIREQKKTRLVYIKCLVDGLCRLRCDFVDPLLKDQSGNFQKCLRNRCGQYEFPVSAGKEFWMHERDDSGPWAFRGVQADARYENYYGSPKYVYTSNPVNMKQGDTNDS
ncbi:hypothetical protein QEH59_00860 [Coraliomargarita sp. SDUM461004]|uniref:Heparin-sulfate lyase N-terminal domain-containing protein n=1 Tax=Thalassobacterium sedimentorum TaxID=3041258 RepID=A0ABU1AGJ2_9BACT|nr:hypothetical protein [Coraliomargarita sp. SDUM461004]MDQ8192955.1 hypothetical protein [Coraliomargarita sp. SDUM461004]